MKHNPDIDVTFDRIQALLNQHAVAGLYEFYDVAEGWAARKHRYTAEQALEICKCVISLLAASFIAWVMLFGTRQTIYIDRGIGILGFVFLLGVGLAQALAAHRHSWRYQIRTEISHVRRQPTMVERLRAAAESALHMNDIGGPHKLLSLSIRISQDSRYYRDMNKR